MLLRDLIFGLLTFVVYFNAHFVCRDFRR